MSRTVKIAISLSEDLLRRTERERHARQETRSQFFRRAVEAFLSREQQQQDIARYVQGYRDMPESEVEAAEAVAIASEALASEPWD